MELGSPVIGLVFPAFSICTVASSGALLSIEPTVIAYSSVFSFETARSRLSYPV